MFHDDFDGQELDTTRWRTCHWWADETGCQISSGEAQWYRPEQVRVGNGVLELVADDRPMVGHPYVSGMVSTGPSSSRTPALFDVQYAAVEARVQFPAGRGFWPAVWMLPSSTESRPEIDIVEMYGHLPDELRMHVHWVAPDGTRESDGQVNPGVDLTDGWHDVGVSWSPDRIIWYLDGERQWAVRGEAVSAEPMYLVLNLAIGGPRAGDPDDDTPFPASMTVDWVRVWARPDDPEAG